MFITGLNSVNKVIILYSYIDFKGHATFHTVDKIGFSIQLSCFIRFFLYYLLVFANNCETRFKWHPQGW